MDVYEYTMANVIDFNSLRDIRTEDRPEDDGKS